MNVHSPHHIEFTASRSTRKGRLSAAQVRNLAISLPAVPLADVNIAHAIALDTQSILCGCWGDRWDCHLAIPLPSPGPPYSSPIDEEVSDGRATKGAIEYQQPLLDPVQEPARRPQGRRTGTRPHGVQLSRNLWPDRDAEPIAPVHASFCDLRVCLREYRATWRTRTFGDSIAPIVDVHPRSPQDMTHARCGGSSRPSVCHLA